MSVIERANRAKVWPQGSNRVKVPELVPDDLRPFAESWLLELRRRNRSPLTQRLYVGTLTDLGLFLHSRGMPTDPTAVTGEHIREYLLDQQDRGLSSKTVYSRQGYLAAFWKWMVDEGEVSASPMAKMKLPSLEETMPQILSDEQFAAMLATCSTGRDPNNRRDAAILMVLEATGVRRAELAGLKIDDFNRAEGTITVMGKGRRQRPVPLHMDAAVALDRYLRERARQRYSKSDALFLARTGPMSPNAVAEVVYKRAKLAGYVDANGRELVHPHMFRHRFADRWKDDGGSEDALMALGGWRNRDIMQRYGRANRTKRAIDEYRRLRG